MIEWILARLERDPAAVFSEKELVRLWAEEFEEAKSRRLLSHLPAARAYGQGLVRPRPAVATDGDLFEAYDEDDLDEEPLVLSMADLASWRFDLDAFAHLLRTENGLEGSPEILNDRLCFVGETSLEAACVGVVFALVNDSWALSVLREIPVLLPSGRYSRVVIVCPETFSPLPSVRRELESLGLFVTSFSSSDFQLDLSVGAEALARASSIDRTNFWHAKDYSSVTYGSQTFQFNPRQATVIRRMHTAFKNQTPDVPWEELRRLAATQDSQPEKMGDVFKGIDGWRKLVTFERRGFWRLNLRAT